MDTSQQGTPAGRTGAERRRSPAGPADVATILILLVLAREVLVSAHNWREYFVVHDYLAGTATDEDLEAVDSGALATAASSFSLMFLVGAAAGVAFVAWLWRARVNAESTSGADAHRRTRIWVIASWFTPVINLWYPHQIVSDVWRTSAPRRPVPLALVNVWWASFLLAGLVRPIQWRTASEEEMNTEHDVLVNANVSTLLTGLFLVAGVLIIVIIRRITAWQTRTV
ncbi:DUF4328 domain-containing protein [Embleya sp. NPDC059259]|uniref:DUF4328 domain-containing protein n=1 Tax=unclassified Embleya TaxID=2699296 RepID=UPI0036C614F1